MMHRFQHLVFVFAWVFTWAWATATSFAAGRPLVAATTSLVGDVVKQVGGEAVDVVVLMPPGTDPHRFEPAARDLADLQKAALVFINGLGLEDFLAGPLKVIDPSGKRIINVSAGVRPRAISGHEGHDHGNLHDPHVWTDPANVIIWTDNIRDALVALVPDQAPVIRLNAEGYRQRLLDLDRQIEDITAALPADRRLLVTDHDMLGYFAARYGFETAGMILPGFSTAAEPSARELAALNTLIRTRNIPALIVGESTTQAHAERLAADTGIRVAIIYSGSLGLPGSGVESYADYMLHNTRRIAEALTPAP